MAKPKILFLDIETSPNIVYTWSLWDANAIQVIEAQRILSFSVEWKDGKVITRGLDDYGQKKHGDEVAEYNLLEYLWELLDEADIVIAHNAIKYDIKKINGRFIVYGMTPPSPYKVIDTLSEMKKYSSLGSNKLDYLAEQLGLDRKIKHGGFEMWKGCMAGDRKSWKKMKEYNRQDVVVLKKLYERISPWVRTVVGGLWFEGVTCSNPDCGSKNLQKRGFARARTRMYQRFVCNDCGAWGRTAKMVKDKKAEIVPVF